MPASLLPLFFGLLVCCSLTACLVPSGNDPIQQAANSSFSSRASSQSASSSAGVIGNNEWVIEELGPGFCGVNGTIDSFFSQNGFTGLGYANPSNQLEGTLRYSIESPAEGLYSLRLRYWNNTTLALGGRLFAFRADGTAAGQADIKGAPTGNQWQFEDIILTLPKGIIHLSLTPSLSQGLPSIDSLSVDNSLTPVNCPEWPASSSASSKSSTSSASSATSVTSSQSSASVAAIVWQSKAVAEVPENTTAIFYFAQAQSPLSANVFFQLEGEDANAFSLQNTGELRFAEAPDYEHPQDRQGKNQYQLILVATDGTHTSRQPLRVEVTNLYQPTFALISPKSRANIGEGSLKNIPLSLRFYDADTQAPIGSQVQVNGVAFTLDPTDHLWKGTLDIPANTENGPTLLTLTGLADGQTIRQTDYLNNKWALKPIALTLPSLDYLYFFDAVLTQVAKLDLQSGVISPVFNLSAGELGAVTEQVDGLPRIYLDANPDSQFVYTALRTSTSKSLLGFATINPLNGAKYGLVPNPLSLIYDGRNQQVVLVAQENGQYRVYGAPITLPFIALRTPAAQAPNVDIPLNLLWAPTANDISGTFKYAAVFKAANALIIADERETIGTAFTHIQAIDQTSQTPLFSTQVGANISPMAVDETRKLLYFADSPTPQSLTLKALNLTTGDTIIIGSSQVGTGPMPSSVTAITYERFSKNIYLADANSDSFFSLNTTSLVRKELKAIRPLPSGN